MPRNADGPKLGSQNYFFVPAALQAELSHADKYRLPYEVTRGDWASNPFPWPGRIRRQKRKLRKRPKQAGNRL